MFVGLALAGTAQATNYPKEVSPLHTGLNPGPLDLNQLDSFLAIHADNTASVYSGRVDLGQGTPTGLLMIIGEELDMNMSQLTFIPSDTNVTPDTGVTVGSSSIVQAGPQNACRRCVREAGPARAGGDAARRSGIGPVRLGRRRVGWRQDRHVRAIDRRQGVQRDDGRRKR